jgi:hypothetical protein
MAAIIRILSQRFAVFDFTGIQMRAAALFWLYRVVYRFALCGSIVRSYGPKRCGHTACSAVILKIFEWFPSFLITSHRTGFQGQCGGRFATVRTKSFRRAQRVD